LSELADEKAIRQDLLYQLKTVEIILPPLRERREDIPQLVEFFLSRYARKNGQPPRQISSASIDTLSGYEWPGNIRALFQSVERALVLGNGDVLEPSDFLLEPNQRRNSDIAFGEFGPRDLVSIERNAISNALKRHSANISRTAKELGISRASLYRRMEKHDLG
jgi:two-component system response regulator HydG